MQSAFQAKMDFDAQRNRVFFEKVIRFLKGQPTRLLAYDEVRKLLGAYQERPVREPRLVPIDHIVGSVGRYQDFTRSFLPLGSVDQSRWVRVNMALYEAAGWPPIEVYKLGDIYFVADGNHRVSVARALGIKEIEAYVTEVPVPVDLQPDITPQELFLKAGEARFLNKTNIKALRPNADIRVTEAGRYHQLLEHIDVHRYYLGLQEQREVPYEEAVTRWYDHVYMPVVEEIRRSGILKNFAKRTEADLYLWINNHGERLRRQYQLPYMPPRDAVNLFLHPRDTKAVIAHLRRRQKDVSAGPDAVDTEEQQSND